VRQQDFDRVPREVSRRVGQRAKGREVSCPVAGGMVAAVRDQGFIEKGDRGESLEKKKRKTESQCSFHS
jgi:hypothetical protein